MRNARAWAADLPPVAATPRRATRSPQRSPARPTVADKYSIARLIEVILSPRASPDKRMYALVELEHYISERIFVREAAGRRGVRDAQFDWTVVLNGVPVLRTWLLTVAECLILHVRVLHEKLQQGQSSDTSTITSELGCALSLLQGMCLTHYPSKYVCSTRHALEVR